jgi:hypothetical protein
MARRILISAYYTPGPYAREAMRLVRSIERLPTDRLAAHIVEVDHVTTWKKAVMWKPTFLLSTLLAYENCDVLYVDADAEFLRVPDWSIFDGVDLSWHALRRHPSHDAEYLTGTMFLRNTPDVRAFVASWAKRTELYDWSDTPEQHSLRDEWAKGEALAPARRWSESLIWRDLPPELVFVFDDFVEIYPGVVPTILHHQASRRLKTNSTNQH